MCKQSNRVCNGRMVYKFMSLDGTLSHLFLGHSTEFLFLLNNCQYEKEKKKTAMPF